MMFKKMDYEKYWPLFLSLIIAFLFFVIIPNKIKIPQNFDNFLTAAITFISIILGFLGVALTIILSIRNTELMEFIFQNTSKERLKNYFKNPIISGFFDVIVTIGLYFFDIYKDYTITTKLGITVGKCILILWIFLSMYFLFSSYRIIDIVMIIIFKDPKETQKRLPSEKIDPEDEKELKNKSPKFPVSEQLQQKSYKRLR
ncbi:hypothetical protein [Caldanaerobacter subterraneus]|uniref:Uncharacterized protein n=1 Tax=Caldanaerobacter subterraneus TaxID=911092 RepID=A0A7Y2PL65_9THEO|nr:hypothetical protein [Caldanaerobacter subterraneus]NNG67734.1 hypothetical protein [Caldanaerobacter subterraneus]